jgi:transposase
MAQNFIGCDREQELLLPPSLREWLPENHLAWFVIDAVGAMDLAGFCAAYRQDGHGRAAHEPSMVLALLVYAYAIGERSSRRIERRCIEDVAVRVIAANQVPDHTTIARFRQRHELALADLFGQVLGLCADAGLVGIEVLAIDGTKIHANASQHANLDYEQIAKKILEEAAEIDAAEDEQFGDRRGDELPPELATSQGRRGWLREAKRRLDDQRAQEAKPIPASRPARLKEAKRRLEEELWSECQANAAYAAYRARGVMKDGRRFGGPPKPYVPPATPAGNVNLTDPDSRNVKTSRGWMQGYNAQAATNDQQTRHRRRDQRRLARLRAPTADGRRRPGRARRDRHHAAAERGVGRRRLLASRPDGANHQPRHPGVDPARRRQTQRHPPGLGRRALQLHAPRPGDRSRRRALCQTPRHDRTRLRPDQVQPPLRPLPTPRTIRGPLGMATDHRHPQPPQALAPQQHPRRSPDPGSPDNQDTSSEAPPATTATLTCGPHPFAQQPPWKAEVARWAAGRPVPGESGAIRSALRRLAL